MRPETILQIYGDFKDDHGRFGLEEVQEIDVHVELQMLYESVHQLNVEVLTLHNVH